MRWNSGVMFLEGNPMLLASSSNDGAVVVWDVKKQPKAMLSGWSPPVVAELVGLHSSGIFAMDQFNGLIATASKDSSVGISRVTAAGEVLMERSVSGHHSGPIRGICFGGEKDRLADCGADGRICVLDTRLREPCALTMESQHYRGVNTIEWCSTNKSLLLSAGKDPVLLLYDIRNPTEPVHKLRGHVSSSTATLSHIYRPSFVGGKMVATPGQGSKKISLYSIDKGSLVSQGWIGYDANLVRFNMDGSKPKLWTAGKQINQLSPLVKLSAENE